MTGAAFSALVMATIGAIVWRVRIASAKRRLREIEQGVRCLSCEKTEMERRGFDVYCLLCGYKTSLATLSSSSVSAEEIIALTKPPS